MNNIINSEMKFCKKCNSYKNAKDFYKGKNVCKSCWNKRELEYRLNKQENIKGEVLKVDKKTEQKYNRYGKDIEESLYDVGRDFDYTINDITEEMQSVISYFNRNMENLLTDKKYLIEDIDNNIKIKIIFDEIENNILRLKEKFIYE
ncbi:hypothetical protein [uncultured Clostridium sp.]|uniref:hypothetical protein n=1 Tax=uncultured Clostridium sp. TaxID=59620 RepID=UPI003217F3E9